MLLMEPIRKYKSGGQTWPLTWTEVDRKYLASIEVEHGRNRSIKLVDEWFRRLGDFQLSSSNDIQKLIEHSQALTLKIQDKLQYVMGCQRFHRWLGKLSSSALCVRAETAPDDIINFISVSTVVLALTLGAATRFIYLSFFLLQLSKEEFLSRTRLGRPGHPEKPQWATPQDYA